MDIQNKFHNAKIYQIVDIGYNKCYIGSTCEELSQRMAHHRANYKQFLNGKRRFITSFNLFNEYGVGNCKIELVEYFKCDTVHELRKREGEIIKKLPCINKCVAGRTYKEWYDDNKIKLCEKLRESYDKEKRREKYNFKKDIINEKLREKYKLIKETDKELYESTKDKLNEQRRERYKLKKLKKEAVNKVENTETDSN